MNHTNIFSTSLESLQRWSMRQPVVTLVFFIMLWLGVYQLLIPASESLVAWLPIERDSHLGGAVQFFFYDTPKVLMLLTGVVFVMGMINSYFTPERTRALLAGRTEGIANIMAATLGIVTPFCSCSAVPLFIGFVQAGVPLGVTFSFMPVLKEKLDGTAVALPTRWLSDATTRLELGSIPIDIIHRNGGHTPGDSMVWLPKLGVVFTGDVVYVDRILGLHPVSKTKTWLASFEALELLSPKIVVPGHGKVTTLANAQADTGNLLKALRTHMSKAVEAGVDISTAVKSFDATPFKHLQHVNTWLPQLANRTYLEIEQE